MKSFVNGLNFRRNFYGDGEVTKIDVEQALELKRQRLLEKENDNSNEVLINNLCDIKFNFDKTKFNITKCKNLNFLCPCWYIFNEFVPLNLQESMEADGNKEISIFNKNAMYCFRMFLNKDLKRNYFSDNITWDLFANNDSVNRFICELCEIECGGDILNEHLATKASNELWSMTKTYFDYLKAHSSDYFLNIISSLCQRALRSFSISTFDLALLYGVHNSDNPKSSGKITISVKRPIIFIIKYKCTLDFLLIPLLFKEAGIDSPVFFVAETPQVLNIKSLLNRIGYVTVRNECESKYRKLQSFIVDKKASMILESEKSICLVLNESFNSYCSSVGDQTEIRVLYSAVNGFIDGRLEDPIIVPLSLSHEYVPKEFRLRSNSLLSNIGFMMLRLWSGQFGIVKLSVTKPIYYSQFTCNNESEDATTIVDTENQLKKLVKHLSVLSDKCQLIMPSNLVAFLLIYHFKDKKSISMEHLFHVGYDLIKYILSSDSLGFEFTPVITNIRRGCNMLSHCISVSIDPLSKSGDCVLTVDWDNFSVISDLDWYADVIVHKILMKSVVAMAFVTEARFCSTMNYLNQISLKNESMSNSISNILNLFLRFFRFLLPCESLDSEIDKLNTWWNETMISPTHETDALQIEGDFKIDFSKWRADVLDSRVRDQILMLSRCLVPRLECLNFIVMELMENKQLGFDSMTPVSEFYRKISESIRKASDCGQLRFKSSLNPDYFISGIITLAAHEIIRIFDISTREWVAKPQTVNLLSARYTILDSEYYNLQRWKTFIDLSLICGT